MDSYVEEFAERNVEWIANAPEGLHHAYVHGPGQGDGSLCGRVTLTGKTHCYNYDQCSYCRSIVDLSDSLFPAPKTPDDKPIELKVSDLLESLGEACNLIMEGDDVAARAETLRLLREADSNLWIMVPE
jgi:hypothetical protein